MAYLHKQIKQKDEQLRLNNIELKKMAKRFKRVNFKRNHSQPDLNRNDL